MSLPPLAWFLDPRPCDDAQSQGIVGAVNIPLAELPGRMHELPPRHGMVLVAGSEPLVSETITFLETNGRRAQPGLDWEYGEALPCRLWEPNAFLMEVVSHLPPGTAFDLACGTGRDAVALAAEGWRVCAVDHLQDALDRGRNLAAGYLPADQAAAIEWLQRDLERDSSLNLEGANLVSMAWFLNRDLIRKVVETLEPGASLVVETFTSIHRERYGKPRTESFVLAPGEIRELVWPMEIRFHEEDWHGERHSARLWAIKQHPDCAEWSHATPET